MTWQDSLKEHSTRAWCYRLVVLHLQQKSSKCGYARHIASAIGRGTCDDDFDWVNALLREMGEKGLIFYHVGSGWQLRKGVCWPVHLLNPTEEVAP